MLISFIYKWSWPVKSRLKHFSEINEMSKRRKTVLFVNIKYILGDYLIIRYISSCHSKGKIFIFPGSFL